MRVCCAVILLLAVAATASARHPHLARARPLPEGFSVQAESQIVVGISSGAFFASQYHVAYSSTLVGVGMVAGGPYYCAQDSITTAELSCMYNFQQIDVSSLETVAKNCATNGQCDSTDNIKGQKAWLFSGTKDSVVKTAVVQAAQQFYSDLGATVNSTYTLDAEHSWPTANFGNACDYLGSPYINNCLFDASYSMTDFLLGGVNPPTTANPNNIRTLDQSKFTPNGADPASISFGPSAYVYVPSACQTTSSCRLVIALHGCQQTIDDIAEKFVLDIGLNEIAEANKLVVLYPQAIKDSTVGNPEGCYDWWGYTDSNYSNNQGSQMQTVRNMAKSLTGSN